MFTPHSLMSLCWNRGEKREKSKVGVGGGRWGGGGGEGEMKGKDENRHRQRSYVPLPLCDTRLYMFPSSIHSLFIDAISGTIICLYRTL